MKVLVTGSSGHLGEALVRTMRRSGHQTTGVDIISSSVTDIVDTISNRDVTERCMDGVDVVLHTATLHKPHVVTHTRQEFVDTNITGTLNLLEESIKNRVTSFIFTSTTSVFGRALIPPPDSPAAWITEEVAPIPKNIYGVTKAAAENLCQLFHLHHGLPCLILRTSRFFPEEDDRKETRDSYEDGNAKTNEFLHRRVELSDVVSAHQIAMDRAEDLGFGRYIISATTPFTKDDLCDLRKDAPAVVRRIYPGYVEEYESRNWTMFPGIDRVYVNEKARTELGWTPRYDFAEILKLLQDGNDPRSQLTQEVGIKRYHAQEFSEGPYPVE